MERCEGLYPPSTPTNSTRIFKNGYRRGKQSFRCRQCGRQFVSNPQKQPYSSEVKQLCIKMYLNGMGLRGIERVTEIHHTTVINWIKEAGIKLPDVPEEDEIPEITEIAVRPRCGNRSKGTRTKRDELQTFVGNKKNKIWRSGYRRKRHAPIGHWLNGLTLNRYSKF